VPAKKGPEPTKSPTIVAKKGNPPPIPSVTPRIAHPQPPTPRPPRVVDAAQPKESPASKKAEAAFPALEATARKLAADGKYGEAFVACRGFVAEHLGTPAAGRAKALQQSLRLELDGIREEHARLFRQAAEKKDPDAARKVIEALALYDAPEIREDQAQMRQALKVLEEKPRQATIRYLAQWKPPPALAKVIRDLKAEEALTRQNAAERLKREKDPSGIGPLIATLGDSDWYVGTKAIEALAAIGDPIALPAVARQTKAAHPVKYNKAAEATEALARAPRDQYEAAWELVDDKMVIKEVVEALQLAEQAEQDDQNGATISPSYQVALLKTLGHLKARGAEAVVREALKSKHAEVRETAAAVLKTLAG
jgi:HEAT repeat protein